MQRIHKALSFLFVVASTLLFSVVAFAEEAATEASGDAETQGMKYLAAGLTIALAASCGAFGQARAASAALEGIARNPTASGRIFTPMILALALIESLVIYALIISFQLIG